MESSRRIALPLAIGLHILLLLLLSRRAVLMQPSQGDGRSMEVQLLPLLEPKIERSQARALAQPAIQQQQTAPFKNRKNQPINAPLVTETPAPTKSVPEAPNESERDSKSALGDPAALVKSYSYEDSKSDLQKAIESHGGTVALTKGKYDDFHQQMDFATIPDCMKPDAMKHDPPKIGPITIGGLPVLLFLAHAAVTGKCKLPGAD
jgi:hypothetical protein